MRLPYSTGWPEGIRPDSIQFPAEVVRQQIVRVCSSNPYVGNYKDGHFEFVITDSESLTSCLKILIDSSILSTAEKNVFQEIKSEFDSKLALEASGHHFSEDEMLPFMSFVPRIQTLREDDKKARIERQKGQSSKPSKDAVMDDQQTSIPYSMTPAVQAIHESLVGACSQYSPYKYKDGRFASDIPITRPVLSCLQCLLDSPYTDADEKAAFATIAERLVALVARETNGETISSPEVEQVTHESCFQLEDVFEADKRARFFKEPKNLMISLPESYTGSQADGPSILLAIAHEILLRGVKDATYLDGQLKDNVAIQTDPLLGLSFLSMSDAVPLEEQTVFEMAKMFAQRLKDFKNQGILDPEPHGILYYEFIKRFTPVLTLFDSDADYRQATRAKWPTYAFIGTSVDPKSKILLSFGWGHGLDPKAADKENSGGGKKTSGAGRVVWERCG